ncbi:YlbF family regulator [Alicyclobacillus dauci]|uniref:YlbF family regulator n=1 Tax=Alicyclobacillus dauci TaxID=1475485 RepID=A0ABY6Z4X9_9BACL|nr:YlbF family regulator [Alicyclobacillus dauci]WAH37924.1 YlbF family regulator [Alicyclobacillus dauci]
MNPYDKAHELVRSIRQSDAYQRAEQSKRAIEQDESTSSMVKDFKRRQIQLQAQQMMGQTPSSEKMSQMQKLSEVIELNQDARAYLQADMELQVLMMDIQRILSEALDEVSLLSLEQIYEEMGRSE